MKPPVRPLSIGYRLIRGALHQLKKAEPQHHQRPQLDVPTEDARWFRLSTLDGVTVTTADGRGAVYRQRDRDKMFALLGDRCADSGTCCVDSTRCAASTAPRSPS